MIVLNLSKPKTWWPLPTYHIQHILQSSSSYSLFVNIALQIACTFTKSTYVCIYIWLDGCLYMYLSTFYNTIEHVLLCILRISVCILVTCGTMPKTVKFVWHKRKYTPVHCQDHAFIQLRQRPHFICHLWCHYK